MHIPEEYRDYVEMIKEGLDEVEIFQNKKVAFNDQLNFWWAYK